jgi:hypothetical protein
MRKNKISTRRGHALRTAIGITMLVLMLVGGMPVKAETTRITDNDIYDAGPQIDDGKIVWLEWDSDTGGKFFDIYMYDISTGTTTWVTENNPLNATHPIIRPKIDAGKIVWEGFNGDGKYVIFMYDIKTGTTTPVFSSIEETSPQLDNGIIVWEEWDDKDYEIFMYDSSTGITTQVTNNIYRDSDPLIDAGKIIWTGLNPESSRYEIFMYDISTRKTTQVTKNLYKGMEVAADGYYFPENYGYSIDAGKVVWTGYDGTYFNIFMYDSSTTISYQVTDNTNVHYDPLIDHGIIVWKEWNGSNDEIFMYDSSIGLPPTELPIQVTDNNYDEYDPHINDLKIVWSAYEGIDSNQIYMYDIRTGTTTQITRNYKNAYPQIDDAGNVVWMGEYSNPDILCRGCLWEIFLSNLENTPIGGGVIAEPKPGVSITFPDVTTGGVTTVTESPTPPGSDKTGFKFLGTYYDITTTAAYTGTLTVCLSYDPTDKSQGWEKNLKIFHWTGTGWDDITMHPEYPDTVTHIICGTTDSLSPFGIAYDIVPDVGTIIAPVDPIAVGTPITVSAPFTTPNDIETAEWNWGDDSTTSGSVTETDGSGSVTGSHTYTEAGIYTITLTVTNIDNGIGYAVYQYVVMYDPSAGFVTGGGWINSPTGAYTADTSLSGKANFGFVSKYKKGATVPTGETEFQFKTAKFNFQSSSYDWLVVAGARAQYKGSGIVNGTGNYGFILTAFDSDVNSKDEFTVDMFRIKIWDKNNGDTIVYDNKPGAIDTENEATELGGGSIVIHAK